MGEGIVLGRVGHYHDAGNGSCSTALITHVGDGWVNVAAWHAGGGSFPRTSVPVDAAPQPVDADRNSFHLAQQCPWGR